MALNTAPSFSPQTTASQMAAQPLAARVARQRPMRAPMTPPMMSQSRGMGGNVPMSGGARMVGNAAGSGGVGRTTFGGIKATPQMTEQIGGPQRFQGDPLMSADSGMIANNAPPPMSSMPPPPIMMGGNMGGGKSMMMGGGPQMGNGGFQPGGGGMMPEQSDMGGIFGRYPRTPDPRFRY